MILMGHVMYHLQPQDIPAAVSLFVMLFSLTFYCSGSPRCFLLFCCRIKGCDKLRKVYPSVCSEERSEVVAGRDINDEGNSHIVHSKVY